MISLKWKGPPFIWTKRETFSFKKKIIMKTKYKEIMLTPAPGLCFIGHKDKP